MQTEIPAALAGERLDRTVATLTGLSRSEVAALIDAGAVALGGGVVTSRSRRVAAGDRLEVDLPEAAVAVALVADPSIEVDVVYADDAVIVVDKAADLVVHPGAGNETATLVHGLLARFPDLAAVGAATGAPDRPGVVHRLDRGTSGLLVVARTAAAHAALVAQLAGRAVERTYLALVWGHPEADRGVIDAPIGRSSRDRTRMAVSSRGREARTRYEVVRRFEAPAVSLLRCSLETGRTHQIRVHLAAIGHPVVGDARYRGARPAIALDRPFLHATALAFDHPVTGERVRFESPLPPDLAAALPA